MQAKRILIAESGTGYGGTAKYLATLLPYFHGRKAFNIEIASYGQGPFIQEIRSQGWTVHDCSAWRFDFSIRIKGIFHLFFQVLPIVKWLKSRQIQVVHLNNEIFSHLPLLIAARWAHCGVLCHLHGWRSLTRIEKWASRYVDQFISVTHLGAEFYSRELGRDVKAVPNGIIQNGAYDPEIRKRSRAELKVQGDTVLTVLVGRLIPLKGHAVFFEALSKAVQLQPLLKALIVGEDPQPDQTYRRQLERQIQALGLESKVQFLPWHKNIGEIYAACDMVVQPSIQAESFGYVALEAMAAGKPVIASRIGGLPEVISDRETGVLVEPGNAGALAQAMIRIAADPHDASQMGQKGKERARTLFTMEKNAAQVSKIYEGFNKEDREKQ